MKYAWMIGLSFLLCFVFAQGDFTKPKQKALAAASPLLTIPAYSSISTVNGKTCKPKGKRLFAGEPFFVRSLVHPTQKDLQRLQRHIRALKAKEPGFGEAWVRGWLLRYRDRYRVPIFDRKCGYLFHTEIATASKELLTAGPFRPLPRAEAQRRLSAKTLPIFVFMNSRTPLYDAYMWVSGSRAVAAFGKHIVYRIVDSSGQPVSPLETKLKPHIFAEKFVLPDGNPSAYWHFQLPVRLKPLTTKP